MVSGSGGQSESRPAPQGETTEPGSFGRTAEDYYSDSRRLSQMMENLLNQNSQLFGQLEESLLNPQYGPSTASEQALLDSVASQTQGASALRGLGPATQGSLAKALAPELANLRQKEIQNLLGGVGVESQRAGIDFAGLLELIGLATPRVNARGQETHNMQASNSIGS